MIRAIRRDPFAFFLAGVATVALGVAICYPLAMVLREALFGDRGLDVSPLVRILSAPVPRSIIFNSLMMGLGAGILGTLLVACFALVLTRGVSGSTRTLLHYAALLPLIAPPFALALSTVFLFGRQGLVSRQLLGLDVNPYGLPGLLFVQTITFFPVAYLIFDSLVRQLDPALEEAALNLGASPTRVLWTVILPLLRPGFAGSFLIIFVESLADLANPLLIGGDYNVLASSAYLAVVGEFDTRKAVAYSVVLMAPSLIAFFAQRLWVGDQSVVTVTGKPSSGHTRVLEPRLRIPLFLIVLVTTCLVALLYMAILAGAFTRLLGIDNTPTLENFRFVIFGIGSRAMTDTTFLSAVAAPIAAVLGLVVAYLTVRTRFGSGGLFDYVTMLGAAAPGIVLGLGILLAFNHPPLLFTGTAVLFVIAFVVRTAPVALRSSVAALLQIDPALEQASANLGAGPATTLRRVTLPLVRGAVLSGLIFSFTRNMTTLSTIALLGTPNWRIMTAQILNEIDAQRLGSGAAYSTILIMIVLVAIVLLTRIFGRGAIEVAT